LREAMRKTSIKSSSTDAGTEPKVIRRLTPSVERIGAQLDVTVSSRMKR
jgi:hypothetical protein